MRSRRLVSSFLRSVEKLATKWKPIKMKVILEGLIFVSNPCLCNKQVLIAWLVRWWLYALKGFWLLLDNIYKNVCYVNAIERIRAKWNYI
jgi:hypothetical protein